VVLAYHLSLDLEKCLWLDDGFYRKVDGEGLVVTVYYSTFKLLLKFPSKPVCKKCCQSRC
jgi:hypothetical protein